MLKLTAVLGVFLLCFAARAADEFKTFEEAKAASFKAEEKGLWKKISWIEASDVALKEAQKSNKPILVFLLVGKWGQVNASEC